VRLILAISFARQLASTMATSANPTRRRRQRRPIDEARGDKPEALREEQVSELAAPAQGDPPGERRDCKARYGADERPQQPACALGGEVK
jgi:hypothetical protein